MTEIDNQECNNRTKELELNKTVIRKFFYTSEDGENSTHLVKYGNVVSPSINGKTKLKYDKYIKLVNEFLESPEGCMYIRPTTEQIENDIKKLNDIRDSIISDYLSEKSNK